MSAFYLPFFLWGGTPGFLLYSCLDKLYTIQAAHPQSSRALYPAEMHSGDPRRALKWLGMLLGDHGPCISGWMVVLPHSLVKQLHRVYVDFINRRVFQMRQLFELSSSCTMLIRPWKNSEWKSRTAQIIIQKVNFLTTINRIRCVHASLFHIITCNDEFWFQNVKHIK